MAIQIPSRPKPSIEPTFEGAAFTCPHCGVLAQMNWNYTDAIGIKAFADVITLSTCQICRKSSVWVGKRDFEGGTRSIIDTTLVFPLKICHKPHEMLPDEIKKDFMEAAAISSSSPRAASALLRLCIQKLVAHLGATEDNLNNAIKELVQKGLSPHIQQALDIVRITGNSAVHPGKMDDEDVADISISLFEIVNLICDELIARPAKIQEIYSKLPQEARSAITIRDSAK